MGCDPAREEPGKGANETKPQGLLFIRGSGFHDSNQGKPRLLITLMFVLRYGGLSEIPAVTFALLYMLFGIPDGIRVTERDVCLLFQESVDIPGYPN